MRLKLLVLASMLTVPLGAQETYTLQAGAPQVETLRQITLALNWELCTANGVTPANCNQANVCTAVSAPGGASCTAAQARSVRARVWQDTQAGREEFIIYGPGWALDDFLAAANALPGKVSTQYCHWWALQTLTVKNAECAKIDAPAGCQACP